MNNGWLKNLLKKLKLNESTISTLLGVLVVVVIGMLIFNYFRGVDQPEEAQLPTEEEEIQEVKLVEEEGELVPESLPTTHRVAAEEHLWAIAEKYYGSGYNWVDIAEENNLENPNTLLVNQELAIPRAAVIKPIEKGLVFGAAITDDQYTIMEGDHLWGIAVRAYGDGYQWTKIAQANGLDSPGLIHPGNTLTLPR